MKKTSHLDYLGHSETKDILMVNYGSIMDYFSSKNN